MGGSGSATQFHRNALRLEAVACSGAEHDRWTWRVADCGFLGRPALMGSKTTAGGNRPFGVARRPGMGPVFTVGFAALARGAFSPPAWPAPRPWAHGLFPRCARSCTAAMRDDHPVEKLRGSMGDSPYRRCCRRRARMFHSRACSAWAAREPRALLTPVPSNCGGFVSVGTHCPCS